MLFFCHTFQTQAQGIRDLSDRHPLSLNKVISFFRLPVIFSAASRKSFISYASLMAEKSRMNSSLNFIFTRAFSTGGKIFTVTFADPGAPDLLMIDHINCSIVTDFLDDAFHILRNSPVYNPLFSSGKTLPQPPSKHIPQHRRNFYRDKKRRLSAGSSLSQPQKVPFRVKYDQRS